MQGYDGVSVAYVWSPPGDYQIAFANILIAAEFSIRNQIVWRKNKLVPFRVVIITGNMNRVGMRSKREALHIG